MFELPPLLNYTLIVLPLTLLAWWLIVSSFSTFPDCRTAGGYPVLIEDQAIIVCVVCDDVPDEHRCGTLQVKGSYWRDR